MADVEHVEKIKHSVEEWNQWRHNHPDIRPNLKSADLSKANLNGADLSEADLRETNLSSADLSGADLWWADFCCADLHRANLRGADISHGDLISEANLSSADLSEADLGYVNLSGANLSGANLSSANLSSANLSSANLSSANLSNANLFKADLSGANLRGTNFKGANLRDANLLKADLSEANLSEAKIAYTIFAVVDLRSAKGLIEINHSGPSIVETHSIQLPQDGSALHFLRGVGTPDEWIDFYRATMMHPIQYYSCFLSYSSTDEHIAKRLHADLQANGVRCWFAPHDLKPGNYVRKEIDQAIHMQDKLLLILSESAVNSGWVSYEVEIALAREIHQQREILFPIRLDNEVLQSTSDWATTLQATRHIGDFTNWTDPQIYQQTFGRLLRDLKKAGA